VTIYLITGDDESLVLEELGTRVHELIGDGDRSLMLDDYDAEKSTVEEIEIAVRAAVDAANTLALFTERRVVAVSYTHLTLPTN
jgi:DNA polymerase-3 subunit delta